MVHRNHLGALQRAVSLTETKVNSFDRQISDAITEHDKNVMENFTVWTEAVNKILADYDRDV